MHKMVNGIKVNLNKAEIAAVEAREAEHKAELVELEKVAYKAKRIAEYPSVEELVIAMWEKDAATMTALEEKRQAVKKKHPKGGK